MRDILVIVTFIVYQFKILYLIIKNQQHPPVFCMITGAHGDMTMNKLFLTEDELLILTGYKYPKLQCKWLTDNGYPFDINRMGKPSVSRSLFTCRETTRPKNEEPNFGAI